MWLQTVFSTVHASKRNGAENPLTPAEQDIEMFAWR